MREVVRGKGQITRLMFIGINKIQGGKDQMPKSKTRQGKQHIISDIFKEKKAKKRR